jgi:hypothetical protein
VSAATPNQAPYTNVPPAQYGGGSFLDPSQTASMYGQGDFSQQKAYTENEFDDEPPLLEGNKIIRHIDMTQISTTKNSRTWN